MEDPDRWGHAEPLLVETLGFLTDDRWVFRFVPAAYVAAEQIPLFPEAVDPETDIVLFSGGLDSVAGVWAQHRERQRPFVLATVYGDQVKLLARKKSTQELQR